MISPRVIEVLRSLQMNLEKHLNSKTIVSYSSNSNSINNLSSKSINAVCEHVISAETDIDQSKIKNFYLILALISGRFDKITPQHLGGYEI